MARLLTSRDVPHLARLPRDANGAFAPCTCDVVQAAVPEDQLRCDMDDICPACMAWTSDLGSRPSWSDLVNAQVWLCTLAEGQGITTNYYRDGIIGDPDDGEDREAERQLNLAFVASRVRRRQGVVRNDLSGWDGSFTHDHFRAHIAAMRRTLTARGVDWMSPIQAAAPLTRAEAEERRARWVTPRQMLALPAVPWARYPGGDGREERDRVRDIIAGALSVAVADSVASMLGLICEVRVDTWMALRDMIASSARIHLIRSTAGYKQDRDSGVVLFEDRPVLAFDIGECADTFCRVGILDAELWRQNLFTAAHAVRLDPVLPLGLLPPDTRDPARPRDPADAPYISMDTLFTARPDAAEEA